jgi:CheY-like chemotaxis protein
MLQKLGYSPSDIHEAYNGNEAVRQMEMERPEGQEIDVVLMDLWMPECDGYEASTRILAIEKYRDSDASSDEGKPPSRQKKNKQKPTILAVTADVTTISSEMASKVGIGGLMTKPYRLKDLERLIIERCPPRASLEPTVGDDRSRDD